MPPPGGMNFAVIAQQVERIIGKDEVPGSNPGNSSKRKDGSEGIRLFLLKLRKGSNRGPRGIPRRLPRQRRGDGAILPRWGFGPTARKPQCESG